MVNSLLQQPPPRPLLNQGEGAQMGTETTPFKGGIGHIFIRAGGHEETMAMQLTRFYF